MFPCCGSSSLGLARQRGWRDPLCTRPQRSRSGTPHFHTVHETRRDDPAVDWTHRAPTAQRDPRRPCPLTACAECPRPPPHADPASASGDPDPRRRNGGVVLRRVHQAGLRRDLRRRPRRLRGLRPLLPALLLLHALGAHAPAPRRRHRRGQPLRAHSRPARDHVQPPHLEAPAPAGADALSARVPAHPRHGRRPRPRRRDRRHLRQLRLPRLHPHLGAPPHRPRRRQPPRRRHGHQAAPGALLPGRARLRHGQQDGHRGRRVGLPHLPQDGQGEGAAHQRAPAFRVRAAHVRHGHGVAQEPIALPRPIPRRGSPHVQRSGHTHRHRRQPGELEGR